MCGFGWGGVRREEPPEFYDQRSYRITGFYVIIIRYIMKNKFLLGSGQHWEVFELSTTGKM